MGREGYGHDPGRLDRIEGIIEAAALKRAGLADEFARLIETQGVLRDQVISFAAEAQRSIGPGNARMDRVEQNLAGATDKIRALERSSQKWD